MSLNSYLFSKINGLLGKSRFLDAVGRAGAEFVIFAMSGWLIVSMYLLANNLSEFWRLLIIFIYAALLGWAINWILAFIIHEPRPFMSGQDHSLFHPMFPKLFSWKSFPSDHTMFSFMIFFMALVLQLPLAWPLLFLAIWVACGRVFSGVHYPSDVVGGAAVALFVASLANYLVNVLQII